MSKRPNMSPSGWLSNLSGQQRQGPSLANRQQQWIKDHSWLTRPHHTTKITKREFAEATELQIIHLLDTSNQLPPR